MTQHVENFNLQTPRDHIFWRSLKIQSRSLKLCIRAGRSSPYDFPFVSLVSSKPKQICIKNFNVNKAGYKGSKYLRLNFYVVIQPATLPNMNELKRIPHRF